MSDKFNINKAIAEYDAIAERYHNDWTTLDQAQVELENLNTKCEEAGVVFKGDPKSLELYIKKDEDESFDESYDSYDDENYSSY